MKSVIGRLRKCIANQRVKQGIVLAVIVATVLVFVRFFQNHPQYWHQLKQVDASTLLWVLVFDSLLLAVLVGVYRTCIELCGKTIERRENFLLTAYSSIINFFGPLQSGPGVRAVYLKKRLHIRLRDYTLATLMYYGMFACLNVLFLFGGSRPWWQSSLAVIAAGGISFYVIRTFQRRDKQSDQSGFIFSQRLIIRLLVLTFLQILLQCIVFYIQLRAIQPGISFSQALTYTGAADLALFVSLTPGAIGFRESFLVFSHSLHHISTATILSANLIDRGMYVLFLGLLALLVGAMHAKRKLRIKS
jgi:uncharacterized membrane protein YbhN (UPF0104 family)